MNFLNSSPCLFIRISIFFPLRFERFLLFCSLVLLLNCLSPHQPYLKSLTFWLCFFFFLTLGLFIYLLIYLWLCWVSVSVRGLSLVAASGGHSSSSCAGLSLSRPLLLRSTGSRRAGSVVVAHGPSRSASMWDLPRPGLEPVSPALAGRFSTTAPPGKPLIMYFLMACFHCLGMENIFLNRML